MRKSSFYILTIDGKAHKLIYTSLKGIIKDFPILSYSAIRKSFNAGSEGIFAKHNMIFRISVADVSRVPGRGKHLNA